MSNIEPPAFQFPITARESLLRKKVRLEESAPLKLKRKIRVLIVDDSATVRERLATMLGDLPDIEIIGYADQVREAIDSVARLKPQVVILDIRMPGGSGIDVLHTIKHDPPSPVVIILTNFPYPQYRKKCLEAGADFFLDKSTEFIQIPNVLEQLKQKTQHPLREK